jgi:hypothetical protein
MNKTLVKRWLNEYLDGEIGLADKAELERRLSQNEELREEFRELRQIGLLMGGCPEVDVHPTRFRARMADVLDQGQRPFFTPQRAFGLAMIIALLVVGLNMALVVYQQRYLGGSNQMAVTPEDEALSAEAGDPDMPTLMLETGVDAERFFSRLMLSYQLGLVSQSTMDRLTTQTKVYDGATCQPGADGSAGTMTFRAPLGQTVKSRADINTVKSLSLLSQELSGRQPPLLVRLPGSQGISLDDFAGRFGSDGKLEMVLVFEPKH